MEWKLKWTFAVVVMAVSMVVLVWRIGVPDWRVRPDRNGSTVRAASSTSAEVLENCGPSTVERDSRVDVLWHKRFCFGWTDRGESAAGFT